MRERVVVTQEMGADSFGVAVAVARVQGLLLEPVTATEAVRQLAEVARDLIPMASGAGITLVDEQGQPTSTASTDPVVGTVDALQYELGEGPCLSAWDTVSVQRVVDTTAETRWPEWAAAAAAAGVRSALSVPLVYRGQEIGALKVYAAEPEAFTEHEEQLLILLATAAAALLGSAATTEALERLTTSLSTTLQERQTIQRAVGVVMERHRIDAEPAQALLLAAARDRQVSLLELAAQVLGRSDDPRL